MIRSSTSLKTMRDRYHDTGEGVDAKKVRRLGLLLFVGLFLAYHINGSVLDEGDAVSNSNLAVALLLDGTFAFSPDRFPEMFEWKSRAPLVEKDDFFFTGWRDKLGAKTTRQWRAEDKLQMNGPRYYLVESAKRDAYVSTFGPVPGIVALPLVATFLAVNPLFYENVRLRATLLRLAAAGLVAGCALLLFRTACRWTTPRRAMLIALVYGLGTCAWAISSQNLWQQTVSQALLMAGAAAFLSRAGMARRVLLAGFCFGAATACRPTGAIALAAVGAYFLLLQRRRAWLFGLGAFPPLLGIAWYNTYYLGSPFTFAQSLVGHDIAMEKTGSPELWQTPLYIGALGLLFSPSRGLLIFSPVLVPSFWGMARVFRRPGWRELRPLAVYVVATMGLQAKWFDWWGGHAYGYRPWMDVIPFLALFLLPVVDDVLRTKPRRGLYAATLAWSMAVQALGALTYDRSWNTRGLHVVEPGDKGPPIAFLEERAARQYANRSDAKYIGAASCDIDLPYCRFRLWSVSDNMLCYHAKRLVSLRSGRAPLNFADLLVTESQMDWQEPDVEE